MYLRIIEHLMQNESATELWSVALTGDVLLYMPSTHYDYYKDFNNSMLIRAIKIMDADDFSRYIEKSRLASRLTAVGETYVTTDTTAWFNKLKKNTDGVEGVVDHYMTKERFTKIVDDIKVNKSTLNKEDVLKKFDSSLTKLKSDDFRYLNTSNKYVADKLPLDEVIFILHP